MDSATTRKDAPAAKAANKPMKTFRLHGISVSVFANTAKIKDRDHTFYKVTMAKTYRDEEGNLQRTGSFDANEIPVLNSLLDHAHLSVINQQVVVTDAGESEK